MLTPLDTLNVDLADFENCDESVQELAAFCAQLLEALRFMLNAN